MKKFSPILLLAMVFSLLNISCMHYFSRHKKYKKNSMALISPVHNSKIKGWVRFQKMEHGRVLVTAKISGLTPNKKHGFHIHRYGDCRENGKYAGPHLNPYGDEHGSLDSEERHVGDMGNLMADSKGVASYKEVVDICLRKVGGRSVVVHANEDDLMTQPSGNAGPYMGCGVIGYTMKPKELNLTESSTATVIRPTGTKKAVSPSDTAPKVKSTGTKKTVSPSDTVPKVKSTGTKKAVSPSDGAKKVTVSPSDTAPKVKSTGAKKVTVSPSDTAPKVKSTGAKKEAGVKEPSSTATVIKPTVKKVSAPSTKPSSETVPETKKPSKKNQ